MNSSRRDLLKLSLGLVPLVPSLAGLARAADAVPNRGRPHSNFNGVQIGLIAPYTFRGSVTTAEAILDSLVDLEVSAVELQNGPVEAFAGAPTPAGLRAGGRSGPSAELAEWRRRTSMDRISHLRRLYEAAGVTIYAFKLGLTAEMSDEEYDYAFAVTKAIGPSAHLTMELPSDPALTARIGRFAEKHRVWVGYHNHTQVNAASWDTALAQSAYNGINLDLGHFTAAINGSPISFIERHHARITSLHFKDRTYREGPNLPWGQGQTPLREVLLLMRDHKYAFPATIELEYGIPAYSTVMNELRRCLDFCRNVLSS